jgi:hypothetical protein
MCSRNAPNIKILTYLLVIFIAGCQTQSPVIPTPTPTSIPCGNLTSDSLEFTCTQIAPDQFQIDADPLQVTFQFADATITLLGTMNIQSSAERLLLTVVTGSAAVNIPDSTRILYAGGSASISNLEGMMQLSIGTLPDSVPGQAELAETCIPLRWQQEYIVQRGDTLSSIAQSFRISLSALMEANCITNPERLPVATRLFIPYASDAQP